MSPERPFGDSGTEHRTEPDHPRQTEEATAAVPTPNRFWMMMTDPGFPSPASNPASLTVMTEAFLCLTSQVQALAGMVQTIIPYLPQLMHSMAHQLAPPAAPPQTESPMAPNRGISPDLEAPPPRVTEVRPASPTPTPARSQSRSYNPASTELDLDTLSTDSIDSLREQVRRVHQRLDEVQKEVFRSREEIGEKKGLLKAPSPMKSHPKRCDKRRYCRFHREYGHDTEECRDLQYQIEDLIRRGHLRRYVREQPPLPDGQPSRDLSPRPQGPVEKQIDVIFGGPTSGGNSSSARKAYVRSEAGKKPLHHEDLDVTFRRAVAKIYNRRVCPRHVKMGDLVLRKIEVSDPTRSRGKLAPNWEAPTGLSMLSETGLIRWQQWKVGYCQ
ncbi:hypothetical protein B296_00056247 [Ensete ventricosum]|uniref:Uncharacterized protein n=1 Tax=Ensete ventricosum TaxID=4639 RepID=A0A426WXS5_ENSVE|nr:hypothetical protein B296_00056247 [Ensete ventricosum]